MEFDSGYSSEQIEAMVVELFKDSAGGGVLAAAVAIGLYDSDVHYLTSWETVVLRTERSELDARVASVRQRIAAGMPAIDAVGEVVAMRSHH
jgi:hypothetical protein